MEYFQEEGGMSTWDKLRQRAKEEAYRWRGKRPPIAFSRSDLNKVRLRELKFLWEGFDQEGLS